jgi:ParB-like chromosome segregation protein Spo0J
MRSSTRPDNDAATNGRGALEQERVERNLLPADPPPAADISVDEDQLPYDLSGPQLSPALVRVIEHFGLPERPVVTIREDEDGDSEYQVLSGASWIRAAREAGLRRVPVRALELSHTAAALLALVLNQPRSADVASQADAFQALLEAGIEEQELVRVSGLGKGRLRRLVGLLELHPVLRQGLREGRVPPQVAFAAAGLSEATQDDLAAAYEEEGELTSARLRQVGGSDSSALKQRPPVIDGQTEPDVEKALAALRQATGRPDDPAARARRQAEELLRTLEEASIAGDIRDRVAKLVEELSRLAVPVA